VLDHQIFANKAVGDVSGSNGGGFAFSGCNTINMQDQMFENNLSSLGGAIYVASYDEDDSLTISNCKFYTNYAQDYDHSYYDQEGGAIYIDYDNEEENDDFIIWNSMFFDNRALSDGGAIYLKNGKLFVENCTIVDNFADSDGNNTTEENYGVCGGIHANNNTLIIENSILWWNAKGN